MPADALAAQISESGSATMAQMELTFSDMAVAHQGAAENQTVQNELSQSESLPSTLQQDPGALGSTTDFSQTGMAQDSNKTFMSAMNDGVGAIANLYA